MLFTYTPQIPQINLSQNRDNKKSKINSLYRLLSHSGHKLVNVKKIQIRGGYHFVIGEHFRFLLFFAKMIVTHTDFY